MADDELTDAKISASEARTETKIARLESKIDLVISKLDDIPKQARDTRNTIWIVGISLALLVVGLAAVFPTFFDMGSKMREAIRDEVHQAISPGK